MDQNARGAVMHVSVKGMIIHIRRDLQRLPVLNTAIQLRLFQQK